MQKLRSESVAIQIKEAKTQVSGEINSNYVIETSDAEILAGFW